jgi:DNA-directed RNA polymerase II subunit RPB1
LAGVASKSNVNQGIPRLKEILKVSKNPTATSLTIYMKPEFRHSKEKARELVQDLELTLLRSITNKVGIYWDPKEESIIEEDRELLEFYKDIELESEVSQEMSKWLLRLELNREEMFNKNISMADVVFVIKMMYPGVNTVYSDYNADKLVMRIHIPEGNDKDDFAHLKKFQSKLLNTCVIRGVPGIKGVTFREDKQKVELVDEGYTPLTQYILDTDGSNYVKVMNHPLVDANRLYSTNIYDVLDILGLEAVRAILVQEIIPIFGADSVNYRHLGILCDYITRSGRLMSIDRYGINKNDVGPLGKMSFEETSKIVMNAALFGEMDPVTGVSANIMMGQPIRGGTAFSQILLDDAMLQTLTKDLEAVPDDEEEPDGDISQFIGEGLALTDPCNSTQFQMNMMMPSSIEGLEDEEPIQLYMKGSDVAITA